MREFKRIAKSIPLSMEVWSGVLHVPLVRWKRRLAGTAALQPLETDRVLHIHELYRMGEKIFGSAPAMARWMEHPHWLFGKAPLAMLTSQQGIEEVMAEIGRIEHGIPA